MRINHDDRRRLFAKVLSIIPDKPYLSLMYGLRMKKRINWRSLQTFNEKLQWLKLYDHRPEYIGMVDKYEVKRYVAERIGKKYIIPTLGVWDRFDDIDFMSLPNQFVLKCTHDSGGIVICRDKNQFNYDEARKKINKSLQNNYFFYGREWPYKYVKPRIIAEEYVEDPENGELRDYKIFCFLGEPRITLVCSERFGLNGLKEDFFDTSWTHLEMKRPHIDNATILATEPLQYTEMKKFAARLSKGIPFARVDFYEVSGKLYFGEITLYPASGFEGFVPPEWDKKLGDWIDMKKFIGGGTT